MFDCLRVRWTKHDLRKRVKCEKLVKSAAFNNVTDRFTVQVKVLSREREPVTFDCVFAASWHFSVPNIPGFEGIDSFPGKVRGSHDFRDPREFKDKNMLCIGSTYSAEDISVSAIISYRKKPTGYKRPENASEGPLLVKVDGRACYFKGGSTADIDAIVFCTGYVRSCKFPEDKLRYNEPNLLCPVDPYKGIARFKGGNKCLKIGIQNQRYTITMLEAEPRRAVKYVAGPIVLRLFPSADKKAIIAIPRDRRSFGRTTGEQSPARHTSYVDSSETYLSRGSDVFSKCNLKFVPLCVPRNIEATLRSEPFIFEHFLRGNRKSSFVIIDQWWKFDRVATPHRYRNFGIDDEDLPELESVTEIDRKMALFPISVVLLMGGSVVLADRDPRFLFNIVQFQNEACSTTGRNGLYASKTIRNPYVQDRFNLSLTPSSAQFGLDATNNNVNDAEEVHGTCYTPQQCRERGGKEVSSCASGFGSCCACKIIGGILTLPVLLNQKFTKFRGRAKKFRLEKNGKQR